jgi:hypothetical protein
MKLHNEELHILYSSPNIIRQIKSRRMRWARHVASMGGEMKLFKVLARRPEGKRPLGRPRRRREDEIRLDLREIGQGSVEWIQLAQDRDPFRALVNMTMNLHVLAPGDTLGVRKFIYRMFCIIYLVCLVTLVCDKRKQ